LPAELRLVAEQPEWQILVAQGLIWYEHRGGDADDGGGDLGSGRFDLGLQVARGREAVAPFSRGDLDSLFSNGGQHAHEEHRSPPVSHPVSHLFLLGH
jgi:hypothetical protein